jgi:ribulose-5-phosphate 4-epimerase/fuculose-1-phosphate aldolase
LNQTTKSELQTRQELAMAYQLAAAKGWGDGIYTHISACVPGEGESYLINQFGLNFEDVNAENLVKVNIKGEILSGAGPVNQSGFAIHGAIHAARPDASCIMHLHVDPVIAVSLQKRGLLPISQHALRFYGDIVTHPYRGLVLSSAEQDELIATMGSKKAVLLQNHGSIICGSTIQQAFYLMDVLEKACRIQLMSGCEENMTIPDAKVCQETYEKLCIDGDQEGQIEWPAYVRLLESNKRR